jgi:hypothetical protein
VRVYLSERKIAAIAEVPPLADFFALSSSFLAQSISRNKSSIIWFRPNSEKH